MYNTLETEKKQKHKLLAIAGVMLAVIIVLIAGIVVIANGKTAKKTIGSGEQGSEFAIVESSDKTGTSKKTATTDESTGKKTSETTSTDESKEKTSSSTATSKASDSDSASAKTTETMPKTGPEDLVPIALALGMLTTVVTAAAMRRHKVLKK